LFWVNFNVKHVQDSFREIWFWTSLTALNVIYIQHKLIKVMFCANEHKWLFWVKYNVKNMLDCRFIPANMILNLATVLNVIYIQHKLIKVMFCANERKWLFWVKFNVKRVQDSFRKTWFSISLTALMLFIFNTNW
jgi:hypothetical protein